MTLAKSQACKASLCQWDVGSNDDLGAGVRMQGHVREMLGEKQA